MEVILQQGIGKGGAYFLVGIIEGVFLKFLIVTGDS
jgi:hypothetical protein